MNTIHDQEGEPQPPQIYIATVAGKDIATHINHHNQDIVINLPLQTKIGPAHLIGVADGISAGNKGTDDFMTYLTDVIGQIDLTPYSSITEIQTAISAQIERFKNKVKDLSEQYKNNNIGSTLTFSVIIGETMLSWHVGDSRQMRIRNGQIEILTLDHTHRMLSSLSKLTSVEIPNLRMRQIIDLANVHKESLLRFQHWSSLTNITPQQQLQLNEYYTGQQNAIVRAILGTGSVMDTDTITLQNGDIYIYTTDGVHKVLTLDQIELIVTNAIKSNWDPATELVGFAKTLLQVNPRRADDLGCVVCVM